MLFDELRKISELKGEEDSREYNDLKSKIKNRCDVEMIYFFTIKAVLSKYGIDPVKTDPDKFYKDFVGSSKNINLVDINALGCVRDQMALSASKEGIVRFSSDGSVIDFDKDALIKHCLQNSESIFKTVQKHLAVENKSTEMSDDELYDMTEQRLLKECSDNAVEADGANRESLFTLISEMYDKMNLCTDSYSSGTFNAYGVLNANNEQTKFIISPLMPELMGFQNLTTMDPGFTRSNDFQNTMWSRCSHSAKERKYVYQGLYGKSKYRTGSHKYPDKVFSFDLETGRFTDNLEYKGFINRKNRKNSFEDKSIGEILFLPRSSEVDPSSAINMRRYIISCQNLLAFKIANTMRKYSQQDLNEDDCKLVKELAENVLKYGPTGTDKFIANRSPEEFDEFYDMVMTKIDDYTDYIDTVCKTMYEKSTHHEFQIHLQDVTNKYKIQGATKTKVIALYSEGDSRQDYDVAKRQESRFNAVVAYARYGEYSRADRSMVESNRAIQPLTGDIIGAGYEAYTIGDITEHAKKFSSVDAESIGEVTSEDIAKMKAFYNNYWLDDPKAKRNMTVIRRADNLEKYMSENGTIDTNTLLKDLRKERDVVKSNMQIQFQVNVDSLKGILNKANFNKNISVNDFVKDIQMAMHDDLLNNYQLNVSEFKAHSYLYGQFYQELKNRINKVVVKNNIDPTNSELSNSDWKKIRNAVIKMVHDDQTQFVSKICDDMFGHDNLIYADQCTSYSNTSYLESMIKLASNSMRCHYMDEYDEDKIKPHQQQFYFSSFNMAMDTLGDMSSEINVVDVNKAAQTEAEATMDVENDNTYDEENEEEDATVNKAESGSNFADMFAEVKDTDKSLAYFMDNSEESIIYRATHPLQYQVMMNVRNSLRVDSDKVHISENGIVYVLTPGNANVQFDFKIGPIIDEEAFVMPVLDEDGNEVNEYVFEGGRLKNPIMFGALDRKSIQPESRKATTVNNRLYGLSAQITPYDGYEYEPGKSEFANRVTFKSYQMGVLAEVDKCLDLYHLAKDTKDLNSDAENQIYKRSKNALIYFEHTFFNNVYNTGTYIIENKEKCAIASLYLSNLIDTTEEERIALITGKSVDEVKNMPDYVKEGVKNTAEVFMAQVKSYRNRCVMPKIMLDQNIGLYNMVLNLDQNNCESIVGKIDRKNLLDSDCKSRRVAMFGTNDIFDTKLSGAAKRLGAISFLRSHIDVDRLSGRVDRYTGREETEHTELPGVGISDVYGRKEFAICEYDNAQAVDRFQLSTNGLLKALRMVPGVKFGMLNLTDNMEDGYVISKKVADRLGHFKQVLNADGTVTYNYVEGIIGDKTGDSSAGNKGIIARIIDPDMPEEDFVRNETMNFFKSLAISGGLKPKENATLCRNIIKMLQKNKATCDFGFNSKFNDIDNIYDLIQNIENRSDEVDADTKVSSGKNVIYDEIRKYCMDNPKVCPKFNSFLKNRLSVYLAFKNNPDVGVFMTNVCVLTRSNPDLVMHISAINDPKQSTLYLEDVDKHIISNDKEVNKDNITAQVGGVGTCVLYLDSHTAEEKNRNYNAKEAKKGGRGYGPQEFFAFDGTKCNDAFIKMLTYQDKLSVKNFDKMNKVLMMNGMYMDYEDGFKMKLLHTVSDNENEEGEEEISVNTAHSSTQEFLSENVDLVDISKIAAEMIKKLDANNTTKKGEIYYPKNVIEALGKLNFDPVVRNDISDKVELGRGSDQAMNMVQQLFYTVVNNGGAFVSMPESNIAYDDISKCFAVYYNQYNRVIEDPVNDDYDAGNRYSDDGMDVDGFSSNDMDDDFSDSFDEGMFIDFEEEVDYGPANNRFSINDYINNLQKMHEFKFDLWTEFETANAENGSVANKRYVPIFTSVSKISVGDNDESSMYKSQTRTQMQLFQQMLAFEVLNQLYVADSTQIKNIENLKPDILKAMDNLKFRIVGTCQNISSDRSLTLNELQDRFKSDIYRFNGTKSRTAVWSGDGAILNQDEVGISFKMAKEFGLITTTKKPLPKDPEELAKLCASKDFNENNYLVEPDNWENAFKNGYSKIDPNAYLFVNRSPGQTTGCVRALKPKIICDDLESIKIHPSIATIFDGDFDGDTVGVIYFDKNQFGKTAEQTEKMFERYLVRKYEAALTVKAREWVANNWEKANLKKLGLEKGSEEYEKVFKEFVSSPEYDRQLKEYEDNDIKMLVRDFRHSQLFTDLTSMYDKLSDKSRFVSQAEKYISNYDGAENRKGEILVKDVENIIFSGDFKNTIEGYAEKIKIREMYNDAMREVSETLTIQQNLIHPAEYDSVSSKIEGNEDIPYVNSLWLAQNADMGIGLYYAQKAREAEGKSVSVYDELEEATIKANILDQYKQMGNEFFNDLIQPNPNNPVSMDYMLYSNDILNAHKEQIERLCSYSDSIKEFHDKLISDPKSPCYAIKNAVDKYQTFIQDNGAVVAEALVGDSCAELYNRLGSIGSMYEDSKMDEEFNMSVVDRIQSDTERILDNIENNIEFADKNGASSDVDEELIFAGKQYLEITYKFKDGLCENEILDQYKGLAECLVDSCNNVSELNIRSSKMFEDSVTSMLENIHNYQSAIQDLKDGSYGGDDTFAKQEAVSPIKDVIKMVKTYEKGLKKIVKANNDKSLDKKAVNDLCRQFKNDMIDMMDKTQNISDRVSELKPHDEKELQSKYLKDSLELVKLPESDKFEVLTTDDAQYQIYTGLNSLLKDCMKDAREGRKQIAKENEKVFRTVSNIYTEAMGKANAKCFTAGATDFDKLNKIISEANISKKGKAPQLNALLSFSGVSDKLAVNKVDGKFMLTNKDGSVITEKQAKQYREDIHMDAKNAKSDVPKNKFRNDIESNIAAQSDKSDATGMGGAVAQKTQKQYASHGYGNVALKVSGPITQRYLDAKQNVAACEKNLTIGKYSLDAVILFRRVEELQDDYVSKNDGADGKAIASQIRSGQFTVTKKPVTINEGMAQLRNLMKVMDLSPLTPIDELKLKASISRTIGAEGDYDAPVSNFLKNCEIKNNQGYRLMYNSNEPRVLNSMIEVGESILRKTLYDNVQSVLKEKIDNHAKSSKTGKGLDIPLQKIISDSTVAVNTKTQKENEKDNRSKTKLTSIKQYHKKEDSSVKAAVKSSFDDRPKDEAAEVKTKATKSLFGKSFKESCAAKIAKNVANAKDSGDDSGKSRRNRKPGE